MELKENKQALAELLDDLVKINSDRIEGYNKANEQMRDNSDLKLVFKERTHQSQNFISDLNEFILKLGINCKAKKHVPGNVFRTWMHIKNTFKSNENASILDGCEFAEGAAVKAYENSLKSNIEIPAEIRQKMLEQQNEIKLSHEFIKKFRDFNLDLTA